MNRKSLVMIALGALVAGAVVLVYGGREEPQQSEGVQAEAAPSTAPAPAGDVAETGATPAAPSGDTPEVLYDFNALPDPVKRMLQQIADAAQSGEIEKMRPVFETNQSKPLPSTAETDHPPPLSKKVPPRGKGLERLPATLPAPTPALSCLAYGQTTTT